jgi:hypothetical protein
LWVFSLENISQGSSAISGSIKCCDFV